MGIFLGLVFVIALSVGIFVSRYSPGVSVFTSVPTFAHHPPECGPSSYTMCASYLPIPDTLFIYWFV